MSLSRLPPPAGLAAALATLAVTLAGAPPAGAQVFGEEAPDSVPRYLQPFYERLGARGGTGDGIFITRAELRAMNVNSVGAAVSLRARREFRTRGRGESCRPQVYWNGIEMRERWDARSGVADTPTDVVEGIEIYYADWMDLPMEYRMAECGVILVWERPGHDGGEDSGTAVLKAALLVALGVVFFLAVGS